jgi:hypothetical protein
MNDLTEWRTSFCPGYPMACCFAIRSFFFTVQNEIPMLTSHVALDRLPHCKWVAFSKKYRFMFEEAEGVDLLQNIRHNNEA